MVENFNFKSEYSVSDVVDIIELLRLPGGCPWDAEQTHQSIKNNFIEETYEVVEAINKDNPDMLREELGDVFMQILLHCQMEKEKGNFDFYNIADELAKKLIIRHPFVFKTDSTDSVEKVLDKWDEIKMKTKNQTTVSESMESVPKELPALMRAQKVQKKAAKVGFDFSNVNEALDKLTSEIEELKSALVKCDSDNAKEELGDILFSAVNVARFIGTDAEETLTNASDKFISRYTAVEKLAKERSIDMKTADMEVLDGLWDEVKEKSI